MEAVRDDRCKPASKNFGQPIRIYELTP